MLSLGLIRKICEQRYCFYLHFRYDESPDERPDEITELLFTYKALSIDLHPTHGELSGP